MDETYLSKSLFIRGLQCHKSLYLHKHHPELKDEIPPSREALFQSGSEVGIMAQRLFPGGLNIPYDPDNYERQVELTREAIEKGITTLYEASFQFDNVFVKVDILHKGKDGWALYEVKSSTSMKDVYIPDAAVQYYVVKGSGLPVSKVFLVHINNQYIREGDIEVDKLFTINDVTLEVRQIQDAIEGELDTQKTMLRGDIPRIDIGLYCRNPYDCDFIGHCWEHIPEGSVFSIKGSRALPFTLYNRGIIRLKDVPIHMLSANQRLQVEATLEKKIVISKKSIQDFLDSLWYPLYFLDFETFSTPIPLFDGTRPYQQIPYQYSLHILESEDSKLKHHEYLAPPGVDPRKELAVKLLSEIPDDACVIAYVAGFEKGILKNLAECFPEFEAKIERIIENMADLALPFQKRYLYHWRFNGSYSLKAVLPALIPSLTYDNMEIRNGDMAMQAYTKMQVSHDQAEIGRIRKALLEYCRLDTLAMVRIVENLKEVIE
ncbi:MAG: DUF2779 domain-containing protein [Proteobacteria bacterium]|nr:DUF2779 domain-containing protein [Pseudomonadota bacterium]